MACTKARLDFAQVACRRLLLNCKKPASLSPGPAPVCFRGAPATGGVTGTRRSCRSGYGSTCCLFGFPFLRSRDCRSGGTARKIPAIAAAGPGPCGECGILRGCGISSNLDAGSTFQARSCLGSAFPGRGVGPSVCLRCLAVADRWVSLADRRHPTQSR
jgi:hypothetical protein